MNEVQSPDSVFLVPSVSTDLPAYWASDSPKSHPRLARVLSYPDDSC